MDAEYGKVVEKLERCNIDIVQDLFNAVERNNLDDMRDCWDKGGEKKILFKNEDGKTPLDVALDKGYFDIIKWYMYEVAKYFEWKNDYDKAIEIYTSVRKNLKDGDIYLDAHLYMGLALDAQKKYVEAAKVLQNAYDERKFVLGHDHCKTAVAGYDLAITFRTLGKYEEAFRLDKEVYNLCKTHLGSDNVETLDTLHNLALDLQLLGKYQAALKIYEEVLTLRKKLLGSDHPDTRMTENNIANINHNKDVNLEKLNIDIDIDIDDLELHKKNRRSSVLPVYCQRLFNAVEQNDLDMVKNCCSRYCCMLVHNDDGKTPLDVALDKGYFDILKWYWDCFVKKLVKEGCYSQAIHIAQSALNKLEDGEMYWGTQLHMGFALCYQTKYEEAEKCFQGAYDGRRHYFGPDHFITILAGYYLAIVFRRLGKYKEALELDKKNYYIAKTALGSDDQDTLDIQHNMAVDLQLLDENEEALKNYEEVLSNRNKVRSYPRATKSATNNIAIIRYGDGIRKITDISVTCCSNRPL